MAKSGCRFNIHITKGIRIHLQGMHCSTCCNHRSVIAWQSTAHNANVWQRVSEKHLHEVFKEKGEQLW